MDISTLETLATVFKYGTVGSIGYFSALTVSWLSEFEDEDKLAKRMHKTFLALSALSSAWGVSSLGILSKERENKIASENTTLATCIGMQCGDKIMINNGISSMQGFNKGNHEDTPISQPTESTLKEVPNQYFFLDTDNNPQTIEYVGESKNTPANIAKWQNADIKVGKIMNVAQWRQMVSTLQRVD